jgi:hemolysin activation/secretion protein
LIIIYTKIFIHYIGNTAAVPPRTTMPYDDFSWYVRPLPPSTKSFNANVHQQHQQLTRTSRQNQRQRRQPPPQLQPQPLEPPPPPPALSVAFTAVACPWWTVLEGKIRFVNIKSQ